MLDEENQLSLLALVAYSYDADIDLEEWLTEYAKNNNTYEVDQKTNYLYMKESLNQFHAAKNTVKKKSA